MRQRLYRSLERLGLYRLPRAAQSQPPEGRCDSLIQCELEAYLVGLQALEEAVGQLLGPCLVQTCDSQQLKRLERMLGIPVKEELALSVRQRMALDRLAMGASDFNQEGMQRALRSAGVPCEIQELPEQGRLRVITQGLTGGFLNLDEVKQAIQAVAPAHLEIELETGSPSWEQLDTMDRSWEEMDRLDLSWEQMELGLMG